MTASTSNPWGLTGRTALVAGGSGGIGAAVVLALADAGAEVTSLDLPGRPAPPGARTLRCDLSASSEVEGAVTAAAGDGRRIDVLVHCVGITRDALLSRMDDGEWAEVLSTNLGSAFRLLRSALPFLRESAQASVVLVSSINGERGKAGQANYAASKAGLNALARTAAREWGRFGIRVNVVAPGWVETAMTIGLPAEVRERALNETVLRRLGRPEDVAGAVLFLASDLSRHVTGQVLRVDGGQLIV